LPNWATNVQTPPFSFSSPQPLYTVPAASGVSAHMGQACRRGQYLHCRTPRHRAITSNSSNASTCKPPRLPPYTSTPALNVPCQRPTPISPTVGSLNSQHRPRINPTQQRARWGPTTSSPSMPPRRPHEQAKTLVLHTHPPAALNVLRHCQPPTSPTAGSLNVNSPRHPPVTTQQSSPHHVPTPQRARWGPTTSTPSTPRHRPTHSCSLPLRLFHVIPHPILAARLRRA